ncbi:MAG: lysostaphin resistance A-like protein [Thermoanaerobaculia bacterium]
MVQKDQSSRNASSRPSATQLPDEVSASEVSPRQEIAEVPPGPGGLPARYLIKEKDGVRVLTCTEAPTVKVKVDPTLTVPAAAARQYPEGTIFLDGVAEAEPFVDAKRCILNLDHHLGCVRRFTLSTCEQALIMVRKGLDLQAREWSVYANQPDLDTILALWVLFNHLRLNGANQEVRDLIIPLIKVEGYIDVHGLEMKELSGLSDNVWQQNFALLQQLDSVGSYPTPGQNSSEIEALDYCVRVLHAVDRLVFSPEDFEETQVVEELARSELPNNRFVVACRAAGGIYEVEKALQKLYGQKLGIIVFEREPHQYTLRLSDPFLPENLSEIYRRLNLVDPAAGNSRSGNRWGGSDEIGGSPRESGSKLTVEEIVTTCRESLTTPTQIQKLKILAQAASLAVAVFLIARLTELVPMLWSNYPVVRRGLDLAVAPVGSFVAVFTMLSAVLYYLCVHQGPGIFGWRRPAGWRWLQLAPIGIATGLAGGSWTPTTLLETHSSPLQYLVVGLISSCGFVIATELLFRGVIYGRLAESQLQVRKASAWSISLPALMAGGLYMLASLALAGQTTSLIEGLTPQWQWVATGTTAWCYGSIAAAIRENSESIIPPVALHLVCLFFFLVLG